MAFNYITDIADKLQLSEYNDDIELRLKRSIGYLTYYA